MSHLANDPANVWKGYTSLQKVLVRKDIELAKAEQTVRNLELEVERLKRDLAEARSRP